jgi:hypothetical protein
MYMIQYLKLLKKLVIYLISLKSKQCNRLEIYIKLVKRIKIKLVKYVEFKLEA